MGSWHGPDVMAAELDPIEYDGRREFYTNGIAQVQKALAVAKPRPRTPRWSRIEAAIGQRFNDRFLRQEKVPQIDDLLGGIQWVKIQ
jgi:hypothetical protein